MPRQHAQMKRALWTGAVSGAAGTAVMDLILFARYKRAGGTTRFVGWETSESAQSWNDASTPGQVGRRLVATLSGWEMPDSWARTTVNVVHWSTGVGWGVVFSVAGHNSRGRPLVTAPILGVSAWLTSYAILPVMKLYEPIWKYDARTLAKDLAVHLTFGAVTTVVFGELSNERGRL